VGCAFFDFAVCDSVQGKRAVSDRWDAHYLILGFVTIYDFGVGAGK
jgi:hypothetical protein